MDFVILGSGGGLPTPRPFCQCSLCKKARKLGEPYKRNNSSIFLKQINGVVDCGEDICDSINRRNIIQVDNLFITHWHPDHTFGLRAMVEANFDFVKGQPLHTINLFIPKKVFKELKKHFDVFDYLEKVQKTVKINLIEDGWSKKINGINVSAIGYSGENSSVFGYLFEEKKKRVFYAPCDTISLKKEILDLDLFIVECGLFAFDKDISEISFSGSIKMIKRMGPKKTIFTHIEECEVSHAGLAQLEKLKKKYSGVNFDFAFDGMKIKV